MAIGFLFSSSDGRLHSYFYTLTFSGSVSALCVWLGPVTTPDRAPSVGERVSLFREPDAGNLPVRFDEREQETEPSQTGLRRRGESPVNYPPGDYSYCACSRLYSRLRSKPLVECDYRAGFNRLLW